MSDDNGPQDEREVDLDALEGIGPGSIVMEMFELIAKLGEGSFATAYMAKQLGTDRRAVVKITHPNLVRGRRAEMMRERFGVEVRASTRVKHANIVTIYTAGDVNGAPAIAMEYVPGETLDDFLREHAPLGERDFIEIFQQLAAGIATLHSAEIVHRDISPWNILLVASPPSDQLTPKLLDFGIAQVDGVAQHTAGPIGTPQFMAPEILRGETSKGADVFSLGSLMWWAATGETLIPAHFSQFDAFKFLSSMSRAPEPTERMSRYSPELRRLIQRALSPDPARRPSASEISGVLARHRVRGSSFDSIDELFSSHNTAGAGGGRSEILLLTYPSVSELPPREALERVLGNVSCCDLRTWDRRYPSLERFDLVLVPMARGRDEVLQQRLLDVVARRGEVRTTIEIHAYSEAMFPREILRQMGIDETWTLPQEAAALRAWIAKRRLATPRWQRVDSDILFQSLEEDSEGAASLIDDFIGGMPEWLLELEEALEEEDRSRLFTLCGELSSRAMSVGAENILAITRELCALSGSDYAARGFELHDSLEAEYILLFRELRELR